MSIIPVANPMNEPENYCVEPSCRDRVAMVRYDALVGLVGGAANLLVLALPFLVGRRWDRSLVMTYGAFLVLATVIYCIELSASWRLEPRLALSRSADRKVLCLSQTSGILLLLTFLIAAVERSLRRVDSIGAAEVMGAGLIAAGCFLRWASIHRLAGRFRSGASVPKGYRLETGGIFALVRHPSEVGLFMISVGAAALMSSGGAVLLAVVHLPVLGWRVMLEDRQLELAIGPEFVAYRRKVAGFVPFVF